MYYCFSASVWVVAVWWIQYCVDGRNLIGCLLVRLCLLSGNGKCDLTVNCSRGHSKAQSWTLMWLDENAIALWEPQDSSKRKRQNTHGEMNERNCNGTFYSRTCMPVFLVWFEPKKQNVWFMIVDLTLLKSNLDKQLPRCLFSLHSIRTVPACLLPR